VIQKSGVHIIHSSVYVLPNLGGRQGFVDFTLSRHASLLGQTHALKSEDRQVVSGLLHLTVEYDYLPDIAVLLNKWHSIASAGFFGESSISPFEV
jgi:hypothetical protein